jgi:hypothetical protein
MTASFKNLLIVGTSAMALLISTSAASASIGVPKGRPYYGSQNQSRGQSFRSYTPAFSTETRQSFSYEPAEKVAPAKNGCQPQAAVAPKAEKQEVAKAPQTTRRSYSYEPSNQSGLQGTARRGGDGTWGGKSPWQYQKTDPRRYGR